MSEPSEAPPEAASAETPEKILEEITVAGDAVSDSASANDSVLDDVEVLDDGNSSLYSDGGFKPDARSVNEAVEDPQPGDGDAITAADANADAIGDEDTEEPGIVEDALLDGVSSADTAANAQLPPSEGAELDMSSAQPAAEVTEDIPSPGATQEEAIAVIDEQPTVDATADAHSPSTSVAVEAPIVPPADTGDDADADDVENADAQNNKIDIDVDEPAPDGESSDAFPTDAESPPLPYIADIAMLDTGEPGETRPSAPAQSSFTSSFQAAAAMASTDDGEESGEVVADDDGPGIDFDKMIDAISAEASDPPVHKVSTTPPIGAPTGPSNPFPRPPTGPARMTGRHANNSLPAGSPQGGAPGNSSQAPPAATGRRAQAARGAQGPNTPNSRQANSAREKAAVDRAYQAFLAEEKIHVGENNWEAFPEGSRMFVGNLAQERVSKRDVFERFHRYGRLAQVSIKSAYGFVQFHSAEEAAAAMRDLEGTEIRGRKIHLEISRLQKKDKGNGRDKDSGRDRERGRGGSDRSPERPKTRGGREGDRYDGRYQDNRRHSKDDHWSSAQGSGGQGSPRRGRNGSDSYSRDRHSHDDYSRRSRDRSRSPQHRHGNRGDDKGYRSRRSPSPYGRSRKDSGRGGHDALKTRHSSEVPDVQFLVAPGLDREFIKWAQAPFLERSLKTDVLYLTTYMPPRDAIIQVHVLEGVIAVVDLDGKAQAVGKIPVQVFNRSAGVKNVRFDGYQDLAPPVAADVVSRAKAAAVAQQHQPAYSQPYPSAPSAPNYGQQYAPAYQQPPVQAAATALYNAADIAALFGQLDNASIAQVIGALQTQQAQAAPVAAPPTSYSHVPQATPYAAAPANAQSQQAQLTALLSTLAATSAPAAPATAGYSNAPAAYPASMPTSAPAAGPYTLAPGVDDQTLQSILAQFSQPRQ